MQQNWKGIGTYSTVGLELAGSVFVGMAVGQWLDRQFETGQLLTLVGLGFGLAAGARVIWRALQRANRDAEMMDQQERKARDDFHDRKQ